MFTIELPIDVFNNLHTRLRMNEQLEVLISHGSKVLTISSDSRDLVLLKKQELPEDKQNYRKLFKVLESTLDLAIAMLESESGREREV